MSIFLVAIGGALGAWLRYTLGLYINKKLSNQSFPSAILLINWIGSFILGCCTGSFLGESTNSLSLFITTGVISSFTTFSTFSVETFILLQNKKWKQAVLYIGLTLVGSVFLFGTGYLLFRS